MLRTVPRRYMTLRVLQHADSRSLSSTAASCSHAPNAPLELDPSLKTLLRDTDITKLGHRARRSETSSHTEGPRELEIFPNDPLAAQGYLTPDELDSLDDTLDTRESRKSPAALFGSQQYGAVVIPFELHGAISKLIAASDKSRLSSDAKRLFLNGTGDDAEWEASYDVKYRSGQQRHRHAERDGTAFASVALPSHYSAIVAVLDHAKQRLGPTWVVDHVLDWGAGTGSGLWASSHTFQKTTPAVPGEDRNPLIASSTLLTYLGIEKQEGLVAMGKRLLKDVDCNQMTVLWQKSFQEGNKRSVQDGKNVLALSAFTLSSLPTTGARKTLIKEMWESGADTIVLIDHGTTEGFDCIAEARDALLRLGRREIKDADSDLPATGCHVVAPCPHDQACPLHDAGSARSICRFSQRLQRPDFVRKTKGSPTGHEDTMYSYVVIRRGARPPPPQHKVGRIGQVGRREIQESADAGTPIPVLAVEGETYPNIAGSDSSFSLKSEDHAELNEELASTEDIEAALRLEAYHWPRLVMPPLKKSGHIILDGCTAQGKIMRMTIPKSQGKQPFYDARKSSWGDIFPHEPKNQPQPRFENGGVSTSAKTRVKQYSKHADELIEKKIKLRKEKLRSRDE